MPTNDKSLAKVDLYPCTLYRSMIAINGKISTHFSSLFWHCTHALTVYHPSPLTLLTSLTHTHFDRILLQANVGRRRSRPSFSQAEMLRSTTSCIPQDAAIQTASALPWGAMVTPLAPSPPPRITPFSETSLSEEASQAHINAAARVSTEIPRCTSCKAYISAKCHVTARNWRCCLCGTTISLPRRYADVVNFGGDAVQLVPELSRIVYDVPVDEDPVTPAAYIFILDENGDQSYLDAARDAIRKALDVVEGETYVGLILYGESLSLLDLRYDGIIRRLSLLDSDLSLTHIFPPDQWLRPTGPKVSNTIMRILSRLKPPPDLYDEDKKVQRALGPAIRAALNMVESASLLASRIVLIGAGEPSFGEGQIEIAESGATTKDRLPAPATTFYSEQGARAGFLGAMVDIYMVSRVPVDIASISPLAQRSGGRLTLYESGEDTLAQDVWQHLNDPAVMRGLLRVRTCSQFAVSEVYGCGVYRDQQVGEVFRLSCHGHTSTLAVDFAFATAEGFSRRTPRPPCVQVAFRGVFLEPGALPQRVIRVETHTYAVSGSRSALRAAADANAIVTLWFHKAIAAGDEQGIGEARMLLFDFLANLIARTAKVDSGCDALVADDTLDKHAALKKIPKVIFGLIRSFLFRQEAVAPDTRAALRCIWEDLSPELLAAAAYPRLFSFANLEEKSMKEVGLSWDAVKQCGHAIFMVDAFSEVVIYYANADRRDLVFPPPESSGIMRVRAGCIRDRPVTPKCMVCREGTAKARWFKALLIEDAAPGAAAQSFSAFMQGVVDAAQDIVDEMIKQQ